MRQIMGCLLALSISSGAYPMDDAKLRSIVQQRLDGDRTGACMAVAVISDEVARAFACADPKRLATLDTRASFEVGSISKTMTATLLAELVLAGELAMDDPLANHLPAQTQVPDYNGEPIRLRHLLNHSAGLPSLAPTWVIADASNPYRALTDADILGALATVQLEDAPGSTFQYSNWGAMLLSWVVSQSTDGDLQSYLKRGLFGPLAMQHAYVSAPPEGVRALPGHSPNQAQVAAWDFPPALAGAGGVRASLDDMIHYMQAQIGRRSSSADGAIALTQQSTSVVDGQRFGMGWMLVKIGDRDAYLHEGATGGFSAFAAFTADHQRAVIVLADTSMATAGGLSQLGMHLLHPSVPLDGPRIAQAAPDPLLQALAGDYELAGGLLMALRVNNGALQIQASGQPAFRMGYDSAGDFYPQAFDAVLRPVKQADVGYSFLWLQGGGAVPARRLGEDSAVPELKREQLAEYRGMYTLMAGLTLKIFVRRNSLYAQATGQPSFRLRVTAVDRFAAAEHGIQMQFERDATGRVAELRYEQNGHSFEAARR